MDGAKNSDWWREYPRMSHDNFGVICNEIRLHIERHVTQFHDPISVEARVAITIWKLANNIGMELLGSLWTWAVYCW